MKVGILTFHDGINHGAFLQAYCLQETIKKLGADVRVINYQSHFHRRQRVKHDLRLFVHAIKNFRNIGQLKSYFSNFTKGLKFRHIQKKKLNLTRFSHNISRIFEEQPVDLLMLGSDEIWNYQNCSRGFDLNYFGQGRRTTTAVSYAPSFGQVSLENELPVPVAENLKQLSAISVRDKNSLQILDSIGLQATKVLDPTFLHDFQGLSGGCKKDFARLGKFILVYSGQLSAENISNIQMFAAEKGCTTVAVSYYQSWCDVNLSGVGISEWLSLFGRADFIVTNTFHGSIFSILNKKQFCVLDLGSKTNKILDLLQDLNLTQVLLSDGDEFSQTIIKKINYEDVFDKIETYKKESLQFIQACIETRK